MMTLGKSPSSIIRYRQKLQCKQASVVSQCKPCWCLAECYRSRDGRHPVFLCSSAAFFAAATLVWNSWPEAVFSSMSLVLFVKSPMMELSYIG